MPTSSNKSLYWHDYETFGIDPRADRPAQFAGIRTDEDLNVISEPLVIYCYPADDALPSPDACLITGITPQKAKEEGYPEAEFIALIQKELSSPMTCGVGYNSIRFDDEFTRNCLYRNFFDPYAREWQQGNSRWDIMDMLRCTYALRPEGIEWPTHEDGKVSFKLEDLTRANGIEHAAAHDALSDVYATIAVAKLVKDKHPKLYDHLYALRDKNKVIAMFDTQSNKPLLHISGMFGVERACSAMITPLAQHPTNKNATICFDLSVDPTPLFELSADEIRARVFTSTANLPEGVERLPLKMIHANKCPVVLPAAMVTPEIAQRLSLNGSKMREHLAIIKQHNTHNVLQEKLQQVFSQTPSDSPSDPDWMLYSGGFFGPSDKKAMDLIRETPARELGALQLAFQDRRLEEMFFRYRARNYHHTLSGDELNRWEEYRQRRLLKQGQGASLTYAEFEQRIRTLSTKELSEEQQFVLQQLVDYANAIYPEINSDEHED